MANRARWWQSVLVGLAVAAQAGCASLTTDSSPVQLAPGAAMVPPLAPSATATPKSGLTIERWWTAFDDPRLSSLIEEALAHNEDLEAALARVREAQGNLDLARSAQLPSLAAAFDAARTQQSTAGAMPLPPGVDRRASSYNAALTASYEVDLWGRLAASTDAARQQLLASGWARAATEWSLTAQVAEAYFGLTAVDRQIEISEAVLAGRTATVRLRQRELDAGAGSEFDLRRAEAEVADTAATIASLAQQRAVLERSLTALLGRTPDEIVSGRLARSTLDESRPWAAVLPHGSAADLLIQRPDVREAEALLAAANANIQAARAAALPSVRLSGVLGSDARSIADLFSGPSIFWSLAVSLTQSIFDGGKVDAQVRISRAQAEQLLALYRKSIAAAVLDVREAYALLDFTEQAFRAEHQRVTALARARELAQIGFDAGAYTYLDLLDAERNWYQSRLQQVAAQRDQRIGQVAAFKALGGGYAGASQVL